MPKKISNKKVAHKFLESAHARENRRLRAEIHELKMENVTLKANVENSKADATVAKSESKKAKPFLDRQKGKKQSGSK